ncbi:MAG: flagellar basal body P-ring formation chaperone FlgA [Burkholderiales bacterium]
MGRILRAIAQAIVFITSVSPAAYAQAAATHPHPAIQRAIDDFLRVQTNGLPGEATFMIGTIDPRLHLTQCSALDVFTPPGSRLWGNTSVGVRCTAPAPWTIYVSVNVQVKGPYVATARPIAAGQPLTEADLALMHGDLTRMPAGVLADTSHAVGKISAAPIAAGQPVRTDLLRTRLAVQQGQTVKLVSSGPGFQVTAEGRALVNASRGQVAQVRTAGGQTVSGIALEDGRVEVRF